MQTMNISLPDPMKQFVEEQVAGGSYSSVSEYIRELVRGEQKRQAKEKLEEVLLESLKSGDAIEATDEWWEELRQESIKRSKSRGKSQELVAVSQRAS